LKDKKQSKEETITLYLYGQTNNNLQFCDFQYELPFLFKLSFNWMKTCCAIPLHVFHYITNISFAVKTNLIVKNELNELAISLSLWTCVNIS